MACWASFSGKAGLSAKAGRTGKEFGTETTKFFSLVRIRRFFFVLP